MVLTILGIGLSFFKDREKTLQGIRKGLKMFAGILPALIYILILVSVLLWIFPKETISSFLGYGSGWISFFVAGIIGAISLIPGFVAYPLANVLLKSGVSYQILAVFITTLMMVGVLTLPIEAKYFGWRSSIIRNVLSFIAAIIIGFLMRFFL
ncbi:MAG: permease [Candidatus Margulisbacteria bacterium]|nr:permease [Candidatus Margulisiibacteriota bacterium]